VSSSRKENGESGSRFPSYLTPHRVGLDSLRSDRIKSHPPPHSPPASGEAGGRFSTFPPKLALELTLDVGRRQARSYRASEIPYRRIRLLGLDVDVEQGSVSYFLAKISLCHESTRMWIFEETGQAKGPQ